MNMKDRTQLRDRFGERVSFDKTEMLFYSHDTASLPGVVMLFSRLPGLNAEAR